MNVQELQHIGNQIAKNLEEEFRRPPLEIIFTASAKNDKAEMVIEVQVTSQETDRKTQYIRVVPYRNTGVNLERFIKKGIHKFLRGK